jgi:ketosteroid isomerase-like protein
VRAEACFLLVLLVGGRTGAAANPEQDVKRRCAELTQRINAHDLGGVRRYFSPQLRVKGSRGTVQTYRQVLLSMGKTFHQYPRFRTTLDVRKVAIKGDKAYVAAAYSNRGMQPKPESGRSTMVWKRFGEMWMLVILDRG